MSTSVNEPNVQKDLTVRIFDDFYKYEAIISAAEYDIVNSFMRSVFSDDRAAANFTVTLFRISQESNIPVFDILEQLQGKNKLELNTIICYYLNGLRSLTTLLGVTQPITANFYTARNVIQ